MMKTRYLLSLSVLLLLVSCKKPADDALSNCVDDYLADHHMVIYTGQEIGGKFYVELYHVDGKDYLALNSRYADVLFNPVDCDGQPYFTGNDIQQSIHFNAYAVRVGIVGVQE